MRVYALIGILLIASHLAAAQGAAANWLFGEGVWMQFQANGQVVFKPDAALRTPQVRFLAGMTSYSVGTRAALITNGVDLYSETLQALTNNPSIPAQGAAATQGCHLLPIEQTNDTLVFQAYGGDDRGTFRRYRNAPLGVVTWRKSGSQSWTRVADTVLERVSASRLAATQHANGRDYWIVGQKWESDTFVVALLTADGRIQVQKQHSGLYVGLIPGRPAPYYDVNDSIAQTKGPMKFSPDGRWLGLSIRDKGTYLYPFDKATGRIGDLAFYSRAGDSAIVFRYPLFFNPNAMGLEFSPDSKKLYVSVMGGGVSLGGWDFLIQYDLSNPDSQAIHRSCYTVSRGQYETQGCRFFAAGEYGVLQLGPNGKIYMARRSCNYLSVIDSPNARGASCGFRAYGQPLQYGQFGELQNDLPTFSSSLFYTSRIRYSPRCWGDSTVFTYIGTDPNLVQLRWKFMDSVETVRDTATGLSVGWRYRRPGSYWLKLTPCSLWGLDKRGCAID